MANIPADDVIIREVARDVWTFSRPFNLFNRLPVGGRSTAIRLKDGSVWILASTPLSQSTKAKLAELGNVKHIIAPNAFHNLFLKQYKDAYPTAKVVGPQEINEKKKAEGWQLDEVISETLPNQKLEFDDEIAHCLFLGHKNKDIAFFHKPSKTVIAADLLFNLPATEQYSKTATKPSFPFIQSLSPSTWIMKLFVWTKEVDSTKMQKDVAKVAAWDFERWIPCHGDVVESDAKELFKKAYGRYF